MTINEILDFIANTESRDVLIQIEDACLRRGNHLAQIEAMPALREQSRHGHNAILQLEERKRLLTELAKAETRKLESDRQTKKQPRPTLAEIKAGALRKAQGDLGG